MDFFNFFFNILLNTVPKVKLTKFGKHGINVANFHLHGWAMGGPNMPVAIALMCYLRPHSLRKYFPQKYIRAIARGWAWVGQIFTKK